MALNDIPKVVLDPNTDKDLLQQMQTRISIASEGKWTDFSPATVGAAWSEGVVYSISELLWFLNQLPEALAIEVFRLAGIQRSPGTYATGELEFLLVTPLSQSFVITTDYQIPYKDSFFTLVSPVIIPPGSIKGTGVVKANLVGSNYNASAFAVTSTSTGLNYLQSYTNPKPIVGGTDLESLDNTVARAQQTIRTANTLVTKADYEFRSQQLLGEGSRATCVPLLTANKTDQEPGHCHVFLVGVDGKPATVAQCQYVKSELASVSYAAASVWVSPVETYDINLEIIVKSTSSAEAIAQGIWDKITDYLSLSTYPLGQTVSLNELAYVIRSADNVQEVQTVRINDKATNQPMPQPYTAPFANRAYITLVDNLGIGVTWYLGNVPVDPD